MKELRRFLSDCTAFAAILADPGYRPTDETGDLSHKMWWFRGKDALGRLDDLITYVSFGRLLFSKDASWDLVEVDPNPWVKYV